MAKLIFLSTYLYGNPIDLPINELHDIQVTNPFAMEECMGDAATKFFNDNNYDFFEQCYIIADYAYPKFIEGLEYNKDRTILPRYVDGIVNAFRRFKTKFY